MILPLTEVDSIRYIHKANKSHERPFESIIDKVYREDKERKEKAENDRKKKEAILHKRELEKRKAEEAERAKEIERHDAENRARQEFEQRTIAEEVSSPDNDRGGRGESVSTSGVIGSTWTEVSPEQASQYMAQGTGVSADVWAGVIYRESSNNPYALNSLGCFGYLQIMQSVHGNVSSWSPQAYLDKAIEIYHSQGAQAWEAW